MKNFIENDMEDVNLAIFHKAIKEYRLDIINYYLNAGVSINTLQDGESAIHIATRLGKNGIVKLLVANGANTDIRNFQGFTSLDIALYMDNQELIEYLLEQGASFCFINGAGEFCIHIAAQRGNMNALKILLDKGANPNIKNIKGYTALDIASLNNNTGMVNFLLTYGAYPNLQNIQSEIPPGLLKERVSEGLSPIRHRNEERKKSSSFINEVAQENNKDIAILLHKVVRLNNITLVQFCINSGADPNVIVNSRTVLEMAISNNNIEIASFLLKQKTIKIPDSLEKKLLTKIYKGEICNEVEQLIVEKLGYYFKVTIVSEAVSISQSTIPISKVTYNQRYIV